MIKTQKSPKDIILLISNFKSFFFFEVEME